MFTISLNYNPLSQYKITKKNTTQSNPVYFRSDFNFSYSPLYDKKLAKNLNSFASIKRPSSREVTVKQLDNVYNIYKQTLKETSMEDVVSAVNTLKNTTNYSEKEILSAMQKATQFGNMKSLKIIAKALNDNDIKTSLMYHDKKSEVFDINGVIHYFFNKKELQKLFGEKYGVILDNNKLNNLEKMKESNPILFNEKINETNKYFILSGFDNGITFLDRSKKLEDVTKAFLEKDIDEENIKRANRLGINPIIIRNNNKPTIKNIYTQLKPEQMTKKQLNAVIDANIMTRISDIQEQVDTKQSLTQYLDNNMKVFTPEYLTELLKKMYSEIQNIMSSENKTMDDVVYGIPNGIKSNLVINYMYQKINHITEEKFIPATNFLLDKAYVNKTMVILDDCAISGEQIKETSSNLNKLCKLKNNNNIVYAPLYCSQMAEIEINSDFNIRKVNDNERLINLTKEYDAWNKSIELTESFYNSLGENGFEQGHYCIIFPYMSPDNNSEFASNIAFFHHINYDENKNLKKVYLRSIKTFNNLANSVSSLTEKLLNDENSY